MKHLSKTVVVALGLSAVGIGLMVWGIVGLLVRGESNAAMVSLGFVLSLGSSTMIALSAKARRAGGCCRGPTQDG
jgi:hypothetical protein